MSNGQEFRLENSSEISYPHAVKSIEPEYHRQYYHAHKAQFREYKRREYARRREEILAKRATPEYRAKLSAYLKEWRARNVEKRKTDQRAWHQKNRSRMQAYRKKYGPRRRAIYAKRRVAILARKRQLAPRYRERVNRYQRRRRRTDIQFMLAGRLRATLTRALRRQWVKKSKRTMELVGCSPQDLKAHIASQFVDGMTWANRHRWHVDHIIPLDSFDLKQIEEQYRAMHWSNLRPLWKELNQRKSNKFTS